MSRGSLHDSLIMNLFIFMSQSANQKLVEFLSCMEKINVSKDIFCVFSRALYGSYSWLLMFASDWS